MADNILKFKNEKMLKPHKIKISKIKNSPILETTVAENLIFKKFLKYALEDIEFQVQMIRNSKMSQEQMVDHILISKCISDYLRSFLLEIERSE